MVDHERRIDHFSYDTSMKDLWNLQIIKKTIGIDNKLYSTSRNTFRGAM